MNDCPCPAGRPTPAALALGFSGAAMACLLARDLLLAFDGNAPAMGFALAAFPLGLAAGLRLAPRFLARADPADLLAPMLGLLALCLPFSLFVLRAAVRPLPSESGAASGVALVVLAALAAMARLCLCVGAGLCFTARVGRRQPTPPRLPLAASLALGAALGAAFVQWVAVPKLSPLTASLDAGIGCCLAGVLCAAGAPDKRRRMETWLPLLAFVFVLVLPLSAIIDARFAAMEWGRAAADIPTAPPHAALAARGIAAALTACLPLLAAGLGAIFFLCKPGTAQSGRAKHLPAAMGLADGAALLGLLLAFAAAGGDLFGRLAGLVAAYAAGQALALPRKGAPCPFAPAPALLIGCALGLALPSLLLLL